MANPEVTYTYTKKRTDFGRQCFFLDEGPRIVEDIKPDKKNMDDYAFINPIDKYAQSHYQQAEDEVGIGGLFFKTWYKNNILPEYLPLFFTNL